ncbi:MAG: DUF6504 family protein [Methylacidiphilales bacterium]|nr:DUF6504 family protein [Candidatus Methylacidiphilales bacterium]
MTSSFVSETITPLEGSFDTRGMARGEPGLPWKFRWRRQEWEVAEVLEQWKVHGDCAHGSGERYVRKHGYRVRTTNGWILHLHFRRSFGRGKFSTKSRWSVCRAEAVQKAGVTS